MYNYTFILAEKLKKFQADILKMDAEEFYTWMAYDMLKDEEFLKRMKKELTGEMSKEERAEAIKDMFRGLGNAISK